MTQEIYDAIEELSKARQKAIAKKVEEVETNVLSAPCICCNKTVTKDHGMFPNEGTFDLIYPYYGSKHDGDILLFAICDDCVTTKKESATVIKVLNTFQNDL